MADVTDSAFWLTMTLPTEHLSHDSVVKEETSRHAAQIVVELVTLILLAGGSIICNALVCLVVHRSRRMQSTTNYFVVSLAAGDLLLTLGAAPLEAASAAFGRWGAGDCLCRITRFLLSVVPAAALLVLVCVSVDRYYTILYPLSFRVTRGTAKRMVTLCWALALLLSSPSLYYFALQPLGPGSWGEPICLPFPPNDHWTGLALTALMILGHYLVPLLVASVFFGRVVRHIWMPSSFQGRRPRAGAPVPRTKAKMVGMLVLVGAITACLFLPHQVALLWVAVAQPSYVPRTLHVGVTWSTLASGVAKPLVYLFYNANFRRGCREVFCMSTMKCYRCQTYVITQTSALGKKNHVGVMDPACDDGSHHQHHHHHHHHLNPGGDSGRMVAELAFNRAKEVEKSVWPLNNAMPNTYL